jgi:hypothetical protein
MFSFLFGYQRERFPIDPIAVPQPVGTQNPMTVFGFGASIAAQLVFEFIEHFRLMTRGPHH